MTTDNVNTSSDPTRANHPRSGTRRLRGIAPAVIVGIIAVALGWTTWPADAAEDSAPSNVVTVTPQRILDTRDGTEVGVEVPFMSATAHKLQITGEIETTNGPMTVVPEGATGVILNVTAVRPTADGFVSVEPGDASGGLSTSSLNFVAGEIFPNLVTVALPTSGEFAGQVRITFQAFASSGSMTHMLADVVGYLTPSGLTAVGGSAAETATSFAFGEGVKTVHSITFNAPAAGTVVVDSSAFASDMTPDEFYVCDVSQDTSLDTVTMAWESAANDFDAGGGLAGTIGQLAASEAFEVGAGSQTFNFNCQTQRQEDDTFDGSVSSATLTYVFVAE